MRILVVIRLSGWESSPKGSFDISGGLLLRLRFGVFFYLEIPTFAGALWFVWIPSLFVNCAMNMGLCSQCDL